MIRTFLPVGQGAFYWESFIDSTNRDINIIYDCGSLTDTSNVETIIRKNFDKNQIIDAVFISHFDSDHVNCIPFLLKHCDVKRIYFPEISGNYKICLQFSTLIKDGIGFTNSFVNNPYNAIKSLELENEPKLIQVEEYRNNNEDNDFERNEMNDDRQNRNENNRDIERVAYGTNVFKSISGNSDYEWLYIPFNFQHSSRIIELEVAFNKEFSYSLTNDKLLELWRSSTINQKKLQGIYKKLKGTMNTNSMTLFSGEIKREFSQTSLQNYKPSKQNAFSYSISTNYNSGCLYTGDYEASSKGKWICLTNAYKNFWDYVGCVQVPHHGSKYNFNSEFLQLDAFFVISAGKKRQHPHQTVVDEIELNHALYQVTEDSNTVLKSCVCLKQGG